MLTRCQTSHARPLPTLFLASKTSMDSPNRQLHHHAICFLNDALCKPIRLGVANPCIQPIYHQLPRAHPVHRAVHLICHLLLICVESVVLIFRDRIYIVIFCSRGRHDCCRCMCTGTVPVVCSACSGVAAPNRLGANGGSATAPVHTPVMSCTRHLQVYLQGYRTDVQRAKPFFLHGTMRYFKSVLCSAT